MDWKFDIRESFSLFGLDIKFYGLLIAIGFSLAVLYGVTRAKHFGIDSERMIDVALVTTPLAFLGARLYYVFFSENVAEYLADPITILQVWNGGLGIYGGVLVAFLIGPLVCKWRKVNPLAMMDVASIGFLIGQCIGRWGNFFNQEAFGGNTAPTNLLGMTGDIIGHAATPHGSGYDPAGLVHPTFLYESLLCLVGFILLHIMSKKCYKFKGQLFCSYAVWYGTGRLIIESLRTDSLMVGQFRVSQVVAVAAILAGITLYITLLRLSRKYPSLAAAPLVEEQPEEGAEETPVSAEETLSKEESVTEEEPVSQEENHGENH